MLYCCGTQPQLVREGAAIVLIKDTLLIPLIAMTHDIIGRPRLSCFNEHLPRTFTRVLVQPVNFISGVGHSLNRRNPVQTAAIEFDFIQWSMLP
jgi:hypothetical protein